MSAASPAFPSRFPLRSDFHHEIGWRDFVRDNATRNPSFIRAIVANRKQFDLGPDPMTLLERWEPLTSSYMFYFWMIREGQTSPSFIVTDGLFNMVIDPLPKSLHLVGMPNFLHSMIVDALAVDGKTGTRSPVMPVLPEAGKPAKSDILPEQMVVHRYGESFAYLAPCNQTIRALAADPVAWAASASVRETLKG